MSNKRSPQAKHDSNELAQLQQLSLSNSNTMVGNRSMVDMAQPAPLFVIEHENVVPPLRTSFDEEKAVQPESSKAPSQHKAPTRNKERQQDRTKVPQQQVSSDTKVNSLIVDEQIKTKPSADKPASAAKTNVKRSIAQTPKLVTMDNEPVPYKRRRRQPSVELAIEDSKNTTTTVNYSKKEPVAVDSFEAKVSARKKATNDKADSSKLFTTTRANKPNKVTPLLETQSDVKQVVKANGSEGSPPKGASNKGPVPAKRRRRQPSTDIAADKV